MWLVHKVIDAYEASPSGQWHAQHLGHFVRCVLSEGVRLSFTTNHFAPGMMERLVISGSWHRSTACINQEIQVTWDLLCDYGWIQLVSSLGIKVCHTGCYKRCRVTLWDTITASWVAVCNLQLQGAAQVCLCKEVHTCWTRENMVVVDWKCVIVQHPGRTVPCTMFQWKYNLGLIYGELPLKPE